MPASATMTGSERAVACEIVRIARDELQLEPAALGFAADADGSAGEVLAAALDSLQLLSLVVAVEDRFRIVLAEEDAAGTRTLADLARLVAARAEPAILPAPAGAP